MRIRFGLGLPGPFVLTGGRRRRSGGGGWLLVVAGLVWLGGWWAWPVVDGIITAVLAGIVVLAYLGRRR